jgi:hypothetical protein
MGTEDRLNFYIQVGCWKAVVVSVSGAANYYLYTFYNTTEFSCNEIP